MLYFIRHGESIANLEKTFAGSRVDSPLTEKGEVQARQTAKNIIESGINFDRIISSPLVRASKTAEIIANEIGFSGDIEIDNRIQEYDMGILSGTPHETINSVTLISGIESEDILNFKNRINSFLMEMEKREECILMVAHAGIARMIETIKKDLPPELFYDLSAPQNGELKKIF